MNRGISKILKIVIAAVLILSNLFAVVNAADVRGIKENCLNPADEPISSYANVTVTTDKMKYSWDDSIFFYIIVENTGNATLYNLKPASAAGSSVFLQNEKESFISELKPGEVGTLICEYSSCDSSPIKRLFNAVLYVLGKLFGTATINKEEYPYICAAKVEGLNYDFGFNVAFSLSYHEEPGISIVDQAIGPYGTAFLGYKKDPINNYYYCDDKDCWQKNAGYNEIYDNLASGAAMLIDQVRIRFTYENKDWMIQFWKGQYGWLLVGAEIGVYTAPEGTYKNEAGAVNNYICADKEDWLKMQLDCYFSNTAGDKGKYVKIFTRPYDDYWWATGFVKGQLTKYNQPRTELKVKGRITLKTQEMADIFVEGLKACGFARATSATQLPDDTYYQNGKDVYVLWSTIYHNCFVGYTG